ncbi:uncharacterized protein [Temnothorax longispinosus]|uniref:uncharacterized protein isoform X1 n=1 Tax=Temnothorax longispinosus TaxID=300112 RepID=UPI003A99366B
MPKPKPKKYALIWWLDSAYKDVVDLPVLPRSSREVNSIASVKWRDNKRKTTINARAKVLAISENRDELENIIVDSRGEIHDASNKIFSKDVLQEKNEITQQEKICKSIKKSNKNRIEETIKKDRPIFDKEHSCKEYIFPSCSKILDEGILFDKPVNDQQPAKNFQKSLEPPNCNNQSEWMKENPVGASKNYPIRKVSESSDIHYDEQPVYTELKNVSCMKNLQSKSKTLSNNPKMSHPTKVQSIAGRNKESEKKKNVSSGSESTKEYSVENSSETSSLDSSDESQSSEKQNFNTAARSFAGLIPFKITKRDIEFLEFLLAAIRHSYESEAKADRNNREIFQIPAHMLKPGDNLVEISPNSSFYLSREKIAYIELKSTRENQCDWKMLVRETLLEVYGESITNYSATGKRGARPAINAILFKALFNWATEKAERPITRKAYIQCINKCASNKRKYRSKKEKNRKRRKM